MSSETVRLSYAVLCLNLSGPSDMEIIRKAQSRHKMRVSQTSASKLNKAMCHFPDVQQGKKVCLWEQDISVHLKQCSHLGNRAELVAVAGGCTRGHTHTQMRSVTHQMRSDTPGKNVSFAFSGVPRINSKLHHRYEHDDPLSPVTTTFSSLPPPPSACVCPTTPRALFLPTSHPRYGRQGPIEQLQAPSGESPLFGPLFANNPPPSPCASLPALVNTHQGKARALFPPHTTLAAST